MKRKILMILTLALMCSVCAFASPEEDHPTVEEPYVMTPMVTPFHWGDTKDAVMASRGHAYVTVLTAKECKKKANCFEKLTYVKTLNNGLNSVISYFFRDDHLTMGSEEIVQSYTAEEIALIYFDMMVTHISASRGVPIINVTDWYINNSSNELPQAVAKGEAGKYAEWEDNDNLVTLKAFGVEGRTKVIAEFFPSPDVNSLCSMPFLTPKRHTCRPSIYREH